VSKKLTLDQFIERSNKTHNFKYDYSKSIFKSRLDKLLIGCKVHGFFEQRASDHLSGRGCAACAGKKKLTKEDFVRRANSIFKNYYDYSNSFDSYLFLKICASDSSRYAPSQIQRYVASS